MLCQILAVLRNEARTTDALLDIFGKAMGATTLVSAPSPAHGQLMHALQFLDHLMEHQIKGLGLHKAADTLQ